MKPGFKQTEVGEIPDDWDVKKLGELISGVEYGTSAKSEPIGRVPVIRMGNIQAGRLDWSNLVYSNDEADIKKYALSDGDVLFNRTNTIDLVGKSAIYTGSIPAIFAGYLIRINTRGEKLDSQYLNYILGTRFSRRYSRSVLSVAVGQANINGQKLKTYPIPLPPTKAEQEAIANALSDADALIESLEKLIEKKRMIKQGAMQDLLTGKKRLPGFGSSGRRKHAAVGEIPVDWICTSLKSTANMNSGNAITSQKLQDGYQYPCYGGNGIRGFSKTFTHDGRHALIGRQGALCGNVILVDGKFYASEHAVVVTPKAQTDIGFLASVLTRLNLNRYSESSAQPGLSVAKILALDIATPSTLQEQQAIDKVLRSIDSEIDALTTKLEKANLIKQGMMQQLLTGNIRLI